MPSPHALAAILLLAAASAQATLTRTNPTPALNGVVAWEPNSAEAWLLEPGRSTVWRYDSGHWLAVSTTTTLPSTRIVACTWGNQGALVVGGGQSWRWNGTSWSPVVPSGAVPNLHAMAFDPLRSVVVGIAPVGSSSTADVFEFDGLAWTLRPSTGGAFVGDYTQAAWNPVTQQVVFYCSTSGGSSSFGWDGSNWSSSGFGAGFSGVAVATAPGNGGLLYSGGFRFPFAAVSRLANGPTPSGFSGPLAPPFRRASVGWFDPVRNHTVITAVVAGNRSSAQWDGTSWSQPVRGMQTARITNFAYDSWRGVVLGCSGAEISGYEHDEFWQIEAGQPSRIGQGPFRRILHSVAFDSWRGRFLMFGGCRFDAGGGSYLPSGTSVHEWDGQAWSVLPATWSGPANPTSRIQAAMAFDRQRGRTVMFGGTRLVVQTSLPDPATNDTFEWDGVSWTAAQPTTLPPPALSPSMAFDASRRQVVLYAGNQFWGWNGTNWNALAMPPVPANNAAVYYDESRDLWIGTAFSLSGPLAWELRGGSWQSITPPGFSGVPAFDLSAGQLVGSDNLGEYRYGDSAAATLRPFGSGCSGSNGVPVLHGEDAPRLGRTVTLMLARAPANAAFFGLLGQETGSWLGLQLPIDLGMLGMTGCALHTPIDVSELRQGGVTWPIAIPSLTTLLGAQLRLQAFVMDAGANPLGATTSNALAMRIGG